MESRLCIACVEAGACRGALGPVGRRGSSSRHGGSGETGAAASWGHRQVGGRCRGRARGRRVRVRLGAGAAWQGGGGVRGGVRRGTGQGGARALWCHGCGMKAQGSSCSRGCAAVAGRYGIVAGWRHEGPRGPLGPCPVCDVGFAGRMGRGTVTRSTLL